MSNYRSISILNALSKLFGKIVTKRIYAICRHHGFMDRQSACSNLVFLKSYIIEAMEDDSQVDVVYTDFSKAFDSVDHTILFHKLAKLGFGQPILGWLKSYLGDRTQYVSIDSVNLASFCVLSGVPQRFHLAPYYLTYL